MTAPVSLPLRIGAYTIGQVRRRLVRVPLSLDDALAGQLPALPPLEKADGYWITSLPGSSLARLKWMRPELRCFVRQRYSRCYVTLDTGFDAYLAGFSARSRSTLKRKLRRFAERSGGRIVVLCYRRPEEIGEFHRHARGVSASTYQERLLDAGLPDGPDAIAGMSTLAAQGRMRGWLLFLDGEPVSYLYAPAEGSTLIYAYLGYDPVYADWSPGTILQLEALRMLMEERRFARFDFTEGEGQHKRQFATGDVECVDLLLLRRTPANLLAGHLLNGFDRSVAFAKRIVRCFGLDTLARRIRR